MFRLMFVDDRVEFGRDEVLSEARMLGLDISRFEAELDSSGLAKEHERRVVEAEARGVFGVPIFLYRDRLYWGNDRLALLEAALKSAE